LNVKIIPFEYRRNYMKEFIKKYENEKFLLKSPSLGGGKGIMAIESSEQLSEVFSDLEEKDYSDNYFKNDIFDKIINSKGDKSHFYNQMKKITFKDFLTVKIERPRHVELQVVANFYDGNRENILNLPSVDHKEQNFYDTVDHKECDFDVTNVDHKERNFDATNVDYKERNFYDTVDHKERNFDVTNVDHKECDFDVTNVDHKERNFDNTVKNMRPFQFTTKKDRKVCEVLFLSTRDCSLQRRHQKLVEEGPALLPDKIECKMRRDVIKMILASGYAGVLTFEFLVYQDSIGINYALLEINTRLQVEHPISELICGVNLPMIQVLLSCGKKLSEMEQGQGLRERHLLKDLKSIDLLKSEILGQEFIESLKFEGQEFIESLKSEGLLKSEGQESTDSLKSEGLLKSEGQESITGQSGENIV
ncbi:Acetyl-CoA carboxylase, partial [Pseudoloma neurophilia]